MGNKLRLGLFFISLIVLGIGFYIISYYQMRIGDDVLFPFNMGFKHYLDNSDWVANERVNTLEVAIKQYAEYYTNFSGRLPALFQGLLFNLLGERYISILSSFIYVGIIVMICLIGLERINKVIDTPAILLLCTLYMYWLTPTGTYISMWTFVCQYGIPLLGYLIYYWIISKAYYMENITKVQRIGIFLLGLVCGWSHECLSVFAILLVTVKLILDGIVFKKAIIERIWLNLGLYLGWIIILAAPGNYKRMFLSHDIARTSAGIFEKISISIYEHLIAAGVLTRKEIWMLIIFILLGIFSFVKKRKTFKKWIYENVEFFAVIVLSIPIWAVFAPPVPQYGLQMWKASVIILLLRSIDPDILKIKTRNILSVIVLVLVIVLNRGWLGDLIEVTQDRRELITEAVKTGSKTVYVDRYPDTTYKYLTLYNYANNNEFSNDYAIKYYGTEILVKE